MGYPGAHPVPDMFDLPHDGMQQAQISKNSANVSDIKMFPTGLSIDGRRDAKQRESN